MKKVHTTEDRILANIIKAELESNQIEVVIMDKKDSSYNTFGFLEIYVPDPDYERAAELVEEALKTNGE